MSYCVRVTPFRDTASTGGFGTVDVSGDPTYLDPNNDGTAPGIPVHQPADRRGLHRALPSGYLGAADYIGPITGSTPAAVPLFTWKPVAGANGYFVIVARDRGVQHHRRLRASRTCRPTRLVRVLTSHVPEPEHALLLGRAARDGSEWLRRGQPHRTPGTPQSFDRPQVGPTLMRAGRRRGGHGLADVLVESDRRRPQVRAGRLSGSQLPGDAARGHHHLRHAPTRA